MAIDMACIFQTLLVFIMIGSFYDIYLSKLAKLYLQNRPNMDRLSLLESLMCLGGNASTFLSDYHQTQGEICVNHCTTSRTRCDGLPAINSVLQLGPVIPVNKTSTQRRNIADSEYDNVSGADGEPSWGTVVFTQHNETIKRPFFSFHDANRHGWFDATRI